MAQLQAISPCSSTNSIFNSMNKPDFTANRSQLTCSNKDHQKPKQVSPVCSMAGNIGQWEEKPPLWWDWRLKGVLTPPTMTELGLNLCVPTAVACAVESLHNIQNGNCLAVSIQELIDCNFLLSSRQQGWFPYCSLEYAKRYGVHLASDYPFSGSGDGCKCAQLFQKKKIYISDHVQLTRPPVSVMKLVVSKQPVIANVDFSPLDVYKGGIAGRGNWKVRHNGDHTVLIVGYNWYKGLDYFIIKNNFGTQWGEDGYLKLECSYFELLINHYVYYPVIDPTVTSKMEIIAAKKSPHQVVLEGCCDPCYPGEEDGQIYMF